ncbi:MAG: ABC transporter ATP-binding protein [Alphaproteobacteria bacterium]|nr:ABC transporter ATP-binding protein [Alphaproteobacteria bacterium]
MANFSASSGRQSVELNLDGISKAFGTVFAVRPVSLTIEPGLLVSLLGPSGCGKTTTLRIIAGFEAPDTGRVLIGGKDVSDLPPNKRNLGMVFQNYSLFPHMTVGENVAFGLKVAGTPRDEIGRRVKDALSLVQLPGYEDRYAHQLSGGQQQRVALARSLVTNPSVLLLDEPLGALDKNLREVMQFELRRIQQQLGITTVLVTHDQEEALTMSDRVAVMSQGRILQYGSPTEVYATPTTRFVSEFLGTSNLFRGKVAGSDGAGLSRIQVPMAGGASLALRVKVADGARQDDFALVAIRPEKMRLGRSAPEGSDHVIGQVLDHVFRGTYHAYQVSVPGRETPLFVYQQAIDADGQGVFAAGSQVHVSWLPTNAVYLADDEAKPGKPS